MTAGGTVLALDIGAARIGVALASSAARLARPAGAMPNDSSTAEALRKLCEREGVVEIVIGLPRGLEGQDTAQTAVARSAGMELARQLDLPTSWQDEALTSAQAEAELKSRGKPYAKGDIDALAATYILEDYLREKV